MRIATWNVNSLKARLEKVSWWLERARPDVLLMQETKLADADAPADAFRDAGYELAHHGEGRWNGVAIASRCGIADVVTNFGEPLRPARTEDAGDDEPLAEARMIAATCGGVRVVCVYAPNGRIVGSPFYEAKLAWFDRLARWLAEAADPDDAARARRRLQRRAHGRRRVGPARLPRRHPRLAAGARGVRAALRLGPRRRVPPAPPRARPLHLVGLSRRQLPQELRHAHRPPAGHAAGRRARRVGRDRPRGAQGQAHPLRPRAARDRPRRSRATPSTRAGRPPRPHRARRRAR